MGARIISNVVSFNEYKYSKYDPVDLRLDDTVTPKKRNIRLEMIKGYMQLLSNQIKWI